MKYMLVHHKVADFDARKKVFDSHTDSFVNSSDAEKGAEAAGVLDEPDCWFLD